MVMATLISNMVGDTTNGAAAKANRKAKGSARASSGRLLPDEGRVRWTPSNSADIPSSLRGRLLPDEGRVRWTPSNSADIPSSLRGRLLPDEGRVRWKPSDSSDIPRSLR